MKINKYYICFQEDKIQIKNLNKLKLEKTSHIQKN